jgi:transcriptional regulator with XRE-family HTH domain
MSNHPLRSYRERAGISLDELASRAGTSKASLSRIETRVQVPSLGLVERIISAAGGELTANDFVGEPGREDEEARA